MAFSVLAAHGRRSALYLGVLVFVVVVALAILWPQPEPEPASANPLTVLADVSAGDKHTCALTTAGGVKCWGLNFSGQLGDGTAIDSTIPMDVAGLTSGATGMSAGDRHTCALTTEGGVKCWGSGFFGQLGTTDTCAVVFPFSCTTPVDVSGLTTGVAAVSAGSEHTCALTTAGGIKCWGRNVRGQLGAPSLDACSGSGPCSLTPVDVCADAGCLTALSNVAAVSAGAGHTCAVTTGGGVKCWGLNSFGQVGDGTTTDRAAPVDVAGLASSAAKVAAGRVHTCALITAGGVKCWGKNGAGQLGDGTTTDRTTPVDVSGLSSGALSVAASLFGFSCALMTSGSVQCWGTPFGSVLTDVEGLGGDAISVTAGVDHGCAVIATGGAKCWGGNGSGQLGNGTTSSSVTAVDVVAFAAKPTPTATPCPAAGCPTPAPCPVEACMQLQVKDGGIPCPAATPADQVCVEQGTGFTLAVDVVKAPDAGYIGVQSFIDYGSQFYNPDLSEGAAGPGTCGDGLDNDGDGLSDRGDTDCVELKLIYKPVAPADEIVWPDLALAVSRCNASPPCTDPFAPAGTAAHGGLTGTLSFPVSSFEGNFLELAFTCSVAPSQTSVELLPLGDPVARADGAGFALPFEEPPAPQLAVPPDSLTVNCVEPPAPTATPLPGTIKSPALQNLWLIRQGAKIPPAQCVGPQGSTDVAVFAQALSQPITSLDPKGSGQPQQLGAFEFEVHYDQSKVCVELQMGPAAVNMTCFVEDSVTKPVLEGVARIGCVTIGKTGFPDTSAPEGRHLADVLVRPQPDVYSQAIPNQGNGVVAQLLNQKCELADLQGHPIPLFSCDDADVTIRYLEGDVEPDCVVNTLDTQAIAFRWGANKGDLLFLDRFNLEPFGAQSDDDVDIKDLQAVYGRIGSTCAAPHPPQGPANPNE